MISPDKWEKLRERLKSLSISESDFIEHFIRSSGNGGQNVNKTNTCVYLKHSPSGFEVKCQETRSQIDNRYFARVRLADKIESHRLGKQSADAREQYRIRKQKKKRSKRAKEKIVEDKRQHAQKKAFRKPPRNDD